MCDTIARRWDRLRLFLSLPDETFASGGRKGQEDDRDCLLNLAQVSVSAEPLQRSKVSLCPSPLHGHMSQLGTTNIYGMENSKAERDHSSVSPQVRGRTGCRPDPTCSGNIFICPESRGCDQVFSVLLSG